MKIFIILVLKVVVRFWKLLIKNLFLDKSGCEIKISIFYLRNDFHQEIILIISLHFRKEKLIGFDVIQLLIAIYRLFDTIVDFLNDRNLPKALLKVIRLAFFYYIATKN